MRQALDGRLLEWLAEAYVRNGDIFSQLYTSTPALATGAIREYTSLPPAQSDAIISTQRRYHNVLGDAVQNLKSTVSSRFCIVNILGH